MTNQHLKDDILYTSPVGKPLIELRALDKSRLVLYTDDFGVFQRFKAWRQLISFTPYFRQELMSKGGPGERLVGVDLYFPRSALGRLLRGVRQIDKTSPNQKIRALKA